LVAAISAQLLWKHSQTELTDRLLLERPEEEFKLEVTGVRPHRALREIAQALNRSFRGVTLWKAHRIWLGALLLFGIAAMVILTLATFRPTLLR
jgi:hypothetical protein